MSHADNDLSWWDMENVPEEDVHSAVFRYVPEVERQQSYLFDRFYKLNCLYDPYFEHLSGFGSWYDQHGTDYHVSENVVAANVDTVTGIVAASEVRARFIPTDGDFKTQRQAKHLEWYVEGLDKKHKVHDACVQAFKDGALKGTGIVKVFIDENDELCVERVPVDDIIVDEVEARHGEPRQMHQRIFYSADELKKRFPNHADEIEAAKGTSSEGGRYHAGYRPIKDDQVVAIESWFLGVRHSITICGATLFDEKYDKDYFPFAVFRWSRRPSGWYGIGGAERVAGHQRILNKNNWQIDRQLDQLAVPIRFVRLADAKLTVQSINRAGSIVPIKGEMPKTEIPPAVSPEVYGRQDQVKESAFEEFGVSRMAASAKKPAGIESGAALREYRDATTQRFAPQEREFEQLKLRANWLMVAVCKELGDKAPQVVRKVYGGRRVLDWKDVDLGEVQYNLAAASNMARTPAGKRQFALELAQSGIISTDSATRMMELEDVDGELSFYTASLKHIDMMIEDILDGGEGDPPEPGHALELGIWRFQMAASKAQMAGAPEERIERLREWRDMAGFILNPPPPPQPLPSALPPDPTMADPMAAGMPADPMSMPPEQPVAALAPQAINTVA